MDYELYCNGRHVHVQGHTSDHICAALWGTKHFYEEVLLQEVLMRHPLQSTILDIGAHCGNHTVFFAEFMHYDRIVAFEPYKPSFAFLCSNVQRYPNVKAIDCGVSNQPGLGAMEPFPGIQDFGSYRMTTGRDFAITTIDACEFKNVTLLKIDVEGLDAHVIEGGMKTIKRDMPTIIIELDQIAVYKAVYDLLKDLYVPVATWNAGGQTYELMPRGMSALVEWDQPKLDLATVRT